VIKNIACFSFATFFFSLSFELSKHLLIINASIIFRQTLDKQIANRKKKTNGRELKEIH